MVHCRTDARRPGTGAKTSRCSLSAIGAIMTASPGSSSSSAASSDGLRSLFVTGVQNAHALEKQARQLMERQIERSGDYPEVEQMLRRHLDETNAQEERLDQILDSLGEDRSVLKDWFT